MDRDGLPTAATNSPDERSLTDLSPVSLSAGSTLPRFIRAEANFLKLPLFALHTKGLRTLDGIECRGTTNRGGQAHEFLLRVTRNTASLYPGPLSRAIHLAFLSIATERAFPLQNPIVWTWRDLCRRMGIEASGRTVRHMREAIRSTARLSIQTRHAIYAKAQDQLLSTHDEELHLYEQVTFRGSRLPDGTIADHNRVWLSDWYLTNLNAMFTAPLDYGLWLELDRQSSIASRLYEFLLLNFFAGSPRLRINYVNLVKFLPIHPEKYPSIARRQLPALNLLAAAGVIAAATWGKGRGGALQLTLLRGRLLERPHAGRQTPLPSLQEDFTADFEVAEVRTVRPPEWRLVCEFYRLMDAHDSHQPTAKELEQARTMLTQHGAAKAKALLPLVVKQLKHRWPDAKTFGAVAPYLPEAVTDYDREERRLQRERDTQAQEEARQEQEVQRAQEWATRKLLWDALPESERAAIRDRLLASSPHLKRTPRTLERLCLDELARGQA